MKRIVAALFLKHTDCMLVSQTVCLWSSSLTTHAGFIQLAGKFWYSIFWVCVYLKKLCFHADIRHLCRQVKSHALRLAKASSYKFSILALLCFHFSSGQGESLGTRHTIGQVFKLVAWERDILSTLRWELNIKLRCRTQLVKFLSLLLALI